MNRLEPLPIFCVVGLFWFAPDAFAQDAAVECGGIGQSPCQTCAEESCGYWPFVVCCWKFGCTCTKPGPYACSGDLRALSGTCDVNRSGWSATPIDDSRNRANCNNMNCWQYDDSVRDKLEMDVQKLTGVTRLDRSQHKLPLDGRYIYVYRKSDNTIRIRHYDRNESDKDWMYPGNCRAQTNFGQYPCTAAGIGSGRYLHVRHSQLNGGWDPIWCAGEMRIENGRVCMANNESGHFRPNKSCLAYLKTTLREFGVAMDANAVFDDFSRASASETCQEIHDEL
jgi:hypothetical protein